MARGALQAGTGLEAVPGWPQDFLVSGLSRAFQSRALSWENALAGGRVLMKDAAILSLPGQVPERG